MLFNKLAKFKISEENSSQKFFRSVKKVNEFECSKNLSSTSCLDVLSVKRFLSFFLFLFLIFSISFSKCTISLTNHSFKSSDSCCFSKKRNSTQNFSSIVNNLLQILMCAVSLANYLREVADAFRPLTLIWVGMGVIISPPPVGFPLITQKL